MYVESGGSQSSKEPSTRPTTDTTNATNGTDNAALTIHSMESEASPSHS